MQSSSYLLHGDIYNRPCSVIMLKSPAPSSASAPTTEGKLFQLRRQIMPTYHKHTYVFTGSVSCLFHILTHFAVVHKYQSLSSSSSSCSLRVRCVPCSLILKVELVPPSLLRSSNVPSSFWSVFQCLSLQSISVHHLYVL